MIRFRQTLLQRGLFYALDFHGLNPDHRVSINFISISLSRFEFLFNLPFFSLSTGRILPPFWAAYRFTHIWRNTRGKKKWLKYSYYRFWNRTCFYSTACNLANRFLSLSGGNASQSILFFLLALIAESTNYEQNLTLFCASCLYAIPGFVPTLVESLLGIGTRRPASKLLELLSIVILLESFTMLHLGVRIL